jgi:hypothetical protein
VRITGCVPVCGLLCSPPRTRTNHKPNRDDVSTRMRVRVTDRVRDGGWVSVRVRDRVRVRDDIEFDSRR